MQRAKQDSLRRRFGMTMLLVRGIRALRAVFRLPTATPRFLQQSMGNVLWGSRQEPTMGRYSFNGQEHADRRLFIRSWYANPAHKNRGHSVAPSSDLTLCCNMPATNLLQDLCIRSLGGILTLCPPWVYHKQGD